MTTWPSLLSDVKLVILSRLSLPDAISLNEASPHPVQTRYIRTRISKLRHLRNAWVNATQPALRSYANPTHFSTKPQRALASVSTFCSLVCLPISGTKVKSLTGIAELKHLRVLDVSHNHLNDVPTELSICKQLRVVHLGKNQLTSFPNVVMQLPELRTLLLHHNKIRTLPTDWTNVPYLYRLGLFDCAIEGYIPEQLCKVLGTQTAQKRSRTANLRRNRFDPEFMAAVFMRFPKLTTAIVI